MAIVSRNPATGEVHERFTAATWPDVDGQLAVAARAATTWARTSIAERGAMLARAAGIFEDEAATLGALMTREMGKPIAAARDEAKKCATACRYYAEHAGTLLRAETIDGTAGTVMFQPIGVVLAIMPWNFPLWQVVRFAAPALAAGNVGLLKHASNVPACALALAALFHRAGAPEGVFQTLLIGSDSVARVIGDARIAAVTLTGSEAAGREVATAAGRHLKKCVLELGGSDPFIVLPSADVDRAAAVAVKARVVNNGQSCIAAKRFIVADAVYDRFLARFAEHMQALRVGDPRAEETEVGPLATAAIRDELARQVEETIAAGARVVLGGPSSLPDPDRGSFYPPTILAEVPPGSPAARDELFGPVAAVFRAADADDALARANDSRFGLGGSVWTTDAAEARRFARDLQAGLVFVNDMVVSDTRFPFGGVKQSGFGRELGTFGLREFVNVKTVRVNETPGALAGGPLFPG